MFDAGETFFGHVRHDSAIDNEAGGRVVAECYTEQNQIYRSEPLARFSQAALCLFTRVIVDCNGGVAVALNGSNDIVYSCEK